MKKKKVKGFTLIELLAIIVILAVIAVITVPIILNVIDNAKKGAIKDSAYGVRDAVRNYYVTEMINPKEVTTIDLTSEDLNYSGNKPIKGKAFYEENGKITLKMYMDGYCVSLEKDGTTVIEKTEETKCSTSKPYEISDIVFFDIEKGESCSNYKEANSLTGYNGLNGTSEQNSCLKFYVLDNTNDERYSLILDHNTTASTLYNESGDARYGPSNKEGYVLFELNEDTKEWNGTETLNNYSKQNIVGMFTYADYTIDYSNYKARLITEDDMQIVSELKGDNAPFLRERTSKTCVESLTCYNYSEVDLMGYYTGTSEYPAAYGLITCAYSPELKPGVRPVIEVLKSKF